MYASIRERLKSWFRRTRGLRWRLGKYLHVEVNRYGRYVELNRRPDPRCGKCEGDGYLTVWINCTDEYAGPCPRCPQPRLLAHIVWGPRKPTDFGHDPPF